MSYLRGEFYIWSSDTHTHFWAAAGDDGWAESVWAEHHAAHAQPGSGPSGVGVPQHITDAYAVMRFAELVDRRELHRAIDRALELGSGNVGCDSLQRHAERLRMAFPQDAPKRIELASQSRIEAVEHLAERFFREVIVEHEYPECLVTDESDLYDFADLMGDRDTEVAAMLDRFRARYTVDPRPLNTTNIVCLLEFLAASGVAE